MQKVANNYINTFKNSMFEDNKSKNVNKSKDINKAEFKSIAKEFKFMIKQTNEVDFLIKKKKEVLENKANETVADYDAAFNQFEVISHNMFHLDNKFNQLRQ